MAKKRKSSGKVISVDFTGVETRELIPDGDYVVKVKEITEEEGEKGQYLSWVLPVSTGEYKGKTLWYNTSLTKQSLWNLRAVLEALGVEVPKSKMNLDLKSYHGLEMGVTVESEKYKGKLKNVIVDVFNLEDEGGEGDDEGEDEGENGEEKEFTGVISEIENDVWTVTIDGEEVDVYTEDAEVTGEGKVGAKVEIKGAMDEDDDLIATEVIVKKKKKAEEEPAPEKKRRSKK